MSSKEPALGYKGQIQRKITVGALILRLSNSASKINLKKQ